MRGRWVAVLALTAMLAGCGTAASRPAAQPAGPPATRAPVGSRAAALMLAGQMLSRLVTPAGSQAAHPSPVPQPLSVSSAGGVGPYTVELHRFVLVREPAAAVRSFLLAHVPAGMGWAGDGLAPGTTNTVTVLWVAYRPRSLAAGLANAELGTAAMPSAGGDTLLRADASVSWFPPRSAAEQLTAASFPSVTVTATEVIPQRRTVTRTITSPAASTSASSRRDRCRQSSTAHDRSGPNWPAQRTTSRCAAVEVACVTRTPDCLPAASTATTVCVRLCASIPSTTMSVSPSSLEGDRAGWPAHLSRGRCHAPIKPGQLVR